MTTSMAPEVKGVLYAEPEMQDLYRGQPVMQMRLPALLRLARANGIPVTLPTGESPPNHERTMSKEELAPRLQMAINDGKIKLAQPRAVQAVGSGVYVPDPAIAEAAFRGEIERANAFQLRGMLPDGHEMRKQMNATKAELIEAIVAVVKAQG